MPFQRMTKLLTLLSLLMPAIVYAHDNESSLSDKAIHDYLIKHPEILIDMTEALQKKQEEFVAVRAHSVMKDQKENIFNNSNDPVVGNPQGDVTLVVFFDNQCGYCKALSESLEKLVLTDKNIRIVYKELPILGPDSVQTSKFALASNPLGHYEAFHNALMADRNRMTQEHVIAIARKVGIDTKLLLENVKSLEISKVIDENLSLAKSLGINATPTMIVGDHLIPGLISYDELLTLIAKERRPI